MKFRASNVTNISHPGMPGKHCDRCLQPGSSFRLSIFNTEWICPVCLAAEQAHPAYQEARDEELRQVQGGNMNFMGVGLPPELQPVHGAPNSNPEPPVVGQ